MLGEAGVGRRQGFAAGRARPPSPAGLVWGSPCVSWPQPWRPNLDFLQPCRAEGGGHSLSPPPRAGRCQSTRPALARRGVSVWPSKARPAQHPTLPLEGLGKLCGGPRVTGTPSCLVSVSDAAARAGEGLTLRAGSWG